MVQHRLLLVAFPSHGMLNPSLQLAKRVVAMGARVTLATPDHMRCRVTDQPTIDGLSFATFSGNYNGIFSFGGDRSEVTRRGSESLTNLIVSAAEEGHPFTCVVYNLLFPWAAEVARGCHLPTALLWIQPATVLDIYYYYFHGYRDYINTKSKDPSSSIELPGLPLLLPRDLPSSLVASNSNSGMHSIATRSFEEQSKELDKQTKPTILVNTFEALEPEALRAVDSINLISIGPLISSPFLDGKLQKASSDDNNTSHDYFQWLDSKPESSVIYVSFGSFGEVSKLQMEEIARALLDFGNPFLWVIKENEMKNIEENGGLSCREELEQKGKIVKWCSQVEVLSHGSLGCFVTHCGWNSTIESLVAGVPMVAFPQFSDQKTNAKLIEDVWKTGLRVDHDEGIVKGEEIRKCLEVVMGNGEKGEELRRNAKKWKELGREAVKEGGSSDQNLRTFLDDVEQCLRVAEN